MAQVSSHNSSQDLLSESAQGGKSKGSPDLDGYWHSIILRGRYKDRGK